MMRFLLALALALLSAAPAHAQQVLGGSNLNSAPPVSSIGNDNQFYIDFATGNIFGPKNLGKWPPSPINAFTTGSGLPTNGGYLIGAPSNGNLTAPSNPTTYSCLASPTCYNYDNINLVDTAPAGTSTLNAALGVSHTFGTSSMTGNAIGIGSYLTQTQATGNTNGNYVGVLSIAHAIGSEGGGGGAMWAGNDNIFFGTGATGWLQLIGREIDTGCSGCGVQDILGSQLVSTGPTLGTRSNIGYLAAGSPSNANYDCAFCVGNYAGYPAVNATSTILGIWPHAVARNASGSAVPSSVGAATTMFGVDMSNATFSAGGAPYVAPLLTPTSSSQTCKVGSAQWDANYIYICTATNTWKRATLATF